MTSAALGVRRCTTYLVDAFDHLRGRREGFLAQDRQVLLGVLEEAVNQLRVVVVVRQGDECSGGALCGGERTMGGRAEVGEQREEVGGRASGRAGQRAGGRAGYLRVRVGLGRYVDRVRAVEAAALHERRVAAVRLGIGRVLLREVERRLFRPRGDGHHCACRVTAKARRGLGGVRRSVAVGRSRLGAAEGRGRSQGGVQYARRQLPWALSRYRRGGHEATTGCGGGDGGSVRARGAWPMPHAMAIDAYGTATRTFVARELADGSGEVGRHLAGGYDGPFERLPFEDRGRHGSDARWEVVKLFQNFVAFRNRSEGQRGSAEGIDNLKSNSESFDPLCT